jgi:Cu(I)/Ag(I) efflux system membrane fusion protein
MVVVHVPEPRARLIREGQPVEIASDDVGELPDVVASVTWVAPELNPEIRAREVHLHLRDPNNRLLPGSLVNARFKAVLGPDMKPADPSDPTTWGHFPLVPASAVLSTGVRNIAWKVRKIEADGRQQFTIAPLALGQRLEDENGNDRFVVRAGLAAGDQVAAQGVFLIDSQAQLAGSASLLYPAGAAAPAPAHQH